AMTDLGIHHYRWGGFTWNNEQPILKQIEAFKPRVAKLAALNARDQASAMYHTHSGGGLGGAAILELHGILAGGRTQLGGGEVRHRARDDRRRRRRLDREFSYHRGISARHRGEGFPLGEECEGPMAADVEAAGAGDGEVR